MKWYRKAAEQGNADGQFELGRCYANGQGAARDKVEAVKWFRKAAEQGFAQAQCELAMQLGFLGDQNEGIKWLREAAQNGVAEAQCELGMAYLGYAAFFDKVVPKDAVEAVQWLGKAAEQGDAQAQGNLGDCYFRGQGTIRDYIQAYKWVNLAAAQGYTGEDLPLSRVEQLMTPDQIAEGKRLSAEFTPGKEMPGQSKEPPGSTSSSKQLKRRPRREMHRLNTIWASVTTEAEASRGTMPRRSSGIRKQRTKDMLRPKTRLACVTATRLLKAYSRRGPLLRRWNGIGKQQIKVMPKLNTIWAVATSWAKASHRIMSRLTSGLISLRRKEKPMPICF